MGEKLAFMVFCQMGLLRKWHLNPKRDLKPKQVSFGS